MTKPTLALIAPIFSVSGYGQHSRMIANALLKLDKYELKIVPIPWGNTPQTALRVENQDHIPILQRIVPRLENTPDISIHISIPSEFQRIGVKSIGITAVTEANFCPPQFIEGANRVDLVIVPSHFTKNVLCDTIIEKREKGSDVVVETLKFNGVCEVLFEGISLETYNKTNIVKGDIIHQLKEIEEDFAFLFVGHWLDARLGQDRKDVGMLIKTFIDAFKNKKKRPALILKTSGAGFSNVERDIITDKINQIQELVVDSGFKGKLPSVYLLNGELNDDEMNTLYNNPKVKAMVTFTKSEGYGIPMAEFSTTGKPILASNYSGHLDFLHPDYCVLLPGSVTKVDDSAANEWIPKGSEWFTVNYSLAGQLMGDVYENYEKYLERSRKQAKIIRDNFSHDVMTTKLGELLDKYCESPKKMSINLPKLVKVN